MFVATLVLAAATAMPLSPEQASEITKEIEQERADTEKWLRDDPSSYLATIARLDFGERTELTVGSAPDNDVKLSGDGISAHHLRVQVVGDHFKVEAVDPGAFFTVKGEKLREITSAPSSLQVGRYTLRLSHQRFPAILVQDPQSPRFHEFKGIQYFPVSLAYRFVLPLTPNPKPDEVVIMSTRGNRRHALRVGWFDFVVDGQPCRLEAHRLLEPGVGENDLIVLFKDATTGKESYPVGRYVDPKPLPDKTFVLDFNEAYNPACAYSPFYNCPLPPRANTLKVAIKAGEKDAHYPH